MLSKNAKDSFGRRFLLLQNLHFRRPWRSLAVLHPEAGVDKGRATGLITDAVCIRRERVSLVTFLSRRTRK
jgi:hypothetical protein